MYIFEWIYNYIRGKKYKRITPDYSPDTQENIIETPEECEHLFLPLDNSGEYFACKYCGLTVNKTELNKSNE